MGQAVAIAIAVIVFIVGTAGGNPIVGLIGAIVIGGMAWLAFAWKPSTNSQSQETSGNSADHSTGQTAATPPQHQGVEDLYAIFFSSAIANSLELTENSPEAKSISELIEPSSLNRDKMLLNIAIVNAALCMIVINFLADIKTHANVILLMEKFTDRVRQKLGESAKQKMKQIPKGELAKFARTEPENKSLTIIEHGYDAQNFVPLDVLFSALFHHRVVEYLKAYADSNDQPMLGGRTADVAHLFCINLLGENFEHTSKAGALLPMSITPLFNVMLDTMMEGLQMVQRHPGFSARRAQL